MDTKLKNITRNSFTKLLAFILVVILITTSVVQLFYLMMFSYNPESIIVSDYKSSESAFRHEINNAYHNTLMLIEENRLVNEENTSLDEESLGDGGVEESNEAEIPNVDLINQGVEVISGDYDYIFYISDGERSYTNREDYSREDFEKFQESFIASENGRFSYGSKTDPNVITRYSTLEDNITLYLAFTDDFMTQEQTKWERGREVLLPIAKSLVAFVLLSIILIVYLTVVTGRLPLDEDLHLFWVDKIWTEIMVGSFILLVGLWFLMATYPARYTYINGYNITRGLNSSQRSSLYIMGVATALAVSVGGVIYLALIRKLKGKRFIKDMLTYKFFHKIFHGIFDFLKSFFDGRRFEKFPLTKSLHQRQIVFIIASFIMVFMTFLLLMAPPLMVFPLALEIVIIYWYVKYNNKTYEDINKGFNESLEEQMKSERMKINLVTNVSHDLKTPLTSIISYVDLLSKEEDLSETARDYVNILGEKSNRLKNIVADLFDLAKSTSGDIHVDFEELDLKKLIEQTIGDMQDTIESSGLTIKTKLPETPVNIRSDGKKLYRVFQNILDNALKYSLQGTRIYVDLEEIEGKAIATIKNTASYEMDFSAEDILQRFNRGDKSRTTEGSGLGLSIAESFTKVSGGDFKVDIDGDLFKVIISFKK